MTKNPGFTIVTVCGWGGGGPPLAFPCLSCACANAETPASAAMNVKSANVFLNTLSPRGNRFPPKSVYILPVCDVIDNCDERVLFWRI